jgi:DNA-binding NtrC family response regulator
MGDVRANILVVDDDASLRSLLIDTLAAIGYAAKGADSGKQALEILLGSRFDMMITDIRMPEMDGLKLRDRVRRLYPNMPVLFVTGVAYPDIIAQASPDGVLAKPFRIAQIEELIESTLDSSRFSSSSR